MPKSVNFLACCPTQYKNGAVENIDEIVSPENSYAFSYQCRIAGQKEPLFCGEKSLYAYPYELEKLVLGHTVLDLLPYYDTYLKPKVWEEKGKFRVELEVNRPHKTEKKTCKTQGISFATALATMQDILKAPGLWDGTGCFHRAALFHPQSGELIFAEDIGRHNCVDRLKGHALLHDLAIEEYFLFITARITSSLYEKIRRAGIKNMVSRSAITSTPWEKARKEQCTLAAFCRPEEKRLTLFCGDNIF